MRMDELSQLWAREMLSSEVRRGGRARRRAPSSEERKVETDSHSQCVQASAGSGGLRDVPSLVAGSSQSTRIR